MAEASYAGTRDFGGEICVENDDESIVDAIPDDLCAIYNNLFDSSDDISDFDGFQCPHSDSNSESSDISTFKNIHKSC